jgi:L-fuconolactonase
MIVDSHQHFWDVSRSDYGWLGPENTVLYRNYLPGDLAPLLIEHEIDATVLIQAAPSESETRYLLELAHAHPFVAGVVGWVNFESPEIDRRIATLVADGRGKLKGLRPMIQDIVDKNWVLRAELDRAFESMIRHHLVFDALVRPSQLASLRVRLLRHPQLRTVLDHAGKPGIDRGEFDTWAEELERLARDTSISVKLSGILTEAGARTSFEDLRPYIEHVFRCFGAERMLWGSDWPVLHRASSYAQWLQLSREWVRRFASRGEEAIFARTAARVYDLELPSTRWPHPSPPEGS